MNGRDNRIQTYARFKLELFIPILKDAIHPIEQENRQLKLVHSTGFDLPCTVDWRRLRM